MPNSVISNSISFLKARQGASPYFANLSNGMDAVQCNHDGSVVATQTVTTTISMWKGSSAEPFVIDNIYRNGTQLMWDGNNNGVWPQVSGGTTVSIEFDTTASISNVDDFKITIHSSNDSSITRELHLTINGVRANAIYRLVPSCSQVVKKKDGTYVPSANITCAVEKVENGITSTPSSSEYTLEKSLNGGSYTSYSTTAPSAITSDLKFRLKVNNVVIDLETIPLVEDGDKGDNAAIALATPDKIAVQCSPTGNVVASQTTSVTFSMKAGTISLLVTGFTRSSTLPTGVTVQNQYSDTCNITIGTSATASGMANGITFTVNGIDADFKTYSATVTIALIGSTQGSRGKVGRFFYYGGEFDINDGSTPFPVNDAQSPFFSYNNGYWVYNPETNPSGGSTTMAAMGTPSSSSADWEIMTNDFKYLMTEALFTDFALLGGFVVSGDYMFSQYGRVRRWFDDSITQGVNPYIDGDNNEWNRVVVGSISRYIYELVIDRKNFLVESPSGDTAVAYTYFLGIDSTPTINENYIEFFPNYCVDMAEGKMVVKDASIEGTLEARALVTGLSKIYATSLRNSYFNNDEKRCSATVIYAITDQDHYGQALGISLPPASTFKGNTITFLAPSNHTTYKALNFSDLHTIFDSGTITIGMNYQPTGSNKKYAKLTIKSDGEYWWIIDAKNCYNVTYSTAFDYFD